MNTKFIFIFYTFSLLIQPCFSQNMSRDSIVDKFEKDISNAVNDSARIQSYISLGNYFLTTSFYEAEKTYNLAIEELKNSKEILSIHKANVFGQLGVIYKRKGDYAKAMEYYLKSKQYYKELEDSSNVANLMHNIAMIYRSQKEYKKAIKNFKNVIGIKRKLGDKVGEGIAYNMLGVVYRKNKQLDSAEISYNRAKTLFIQEKSKRNLPRVDSNLAALYHYQKNYKKSIELHLVNIEYYSKINKLTSLFSSHYNISKTYSVIQQYNKANFHIDEAIQIAKKLNLKDKLSRAYLRKSVFQSDLGYFKTALEYYKKHKKYSDSVYNVSVVKKLQKLELTYKFNKQKQADSLRFVAEKNQLELTKEKEESKKQVYFLLFIVAVLLSILGSILLRIYFKKKNELIIERFEKKEIALKQYTQSLLTKIEEQELELVQKNQERDENTLNKKLHNSIANKILTKEDWYNFKEKFNQVYPLFFKKIKDSGVQLTNSEERLVSLEKLGLDNNQIAKVLGISLDSVFVNRYRLRKKINAPKEVSIIDFLESKKAYN
ncbi:tetratricopeptide repeat protein [Tenacibaculum sp. 190524A05c]|uniref:tetratricopeptide repeat protein n=1 Tax=Tenacibaculum platacis TaxID=3137852 RepID=UPI0032B1D1B3